MEVCEKQLLIVRKAGSSLSVGYEMKIWLRFSDEPETHLHFWLNFPGRPTEVTEKDVYVCESAFDEIKGQIRRLSKPGELKKIVNDPGVTKDEIYFFKKPITPQKVSVLSFLKIS